MTEAGTIAMDDHGAGASPSCCGGTSARACVFANALLARTAICERVKRAALAERELLQCTSPAARTHCATLATLLRERARFALRLPPPGQPLIHVQALRLQCGGLAALRQALGGDERDVHRMVSLAQARHGSLTELPWATLVAALTAWQPPRRSGARR